MRRDKMHVVPLPKGVSFVNSQVPVELKSSREHLRPSISVWKYFGNT